MWIIGLIIIIGIIIIAKRKKNIPRVQEEDKEIKVLIDVPYHRVEGKNWCLPASGRMIFDFYGESITQKEIANRVTKDSTSSIFKFMTLAKEMGYKTDYGLLTIEEIAKLLNEGTPLIIVHKYSLSIPESHCRVIIGIDTEKGEVTLHDSVGFAGYTVEYTISWEYLNKLIYQGSKHRIMTIRK